MDLRCATKFSLTYPKKGAPREGSDSRLPGAFLKAIEQHFKTLNNPSRRPKVPDGTYELEHNSDKSAVSYRALIDDGRRRNW